MSKVADGCVLGFFWNSPLSGRECIGYRFVQKYLYDLAAILGFLRPASLRRSKAGFVVTELKSFFMKLLIRNAVVFTGSFDPRETEFAKVHPRNQQMFRTGKVQQPRSCLSGEVCILVERN